MEGIMVVQIKDQRTHY